MNTFYKRIPVSGPSITQKEVDYVTDAVKNAWYENAGMYNQKFEKAFGEYVGMKYAISLPSCTSALHLSLLSLGIGSDDEVIVPEITWIATSAPISYVGATPVFADIDEKTWCISAESFEKHITSKTKAVIPVDLYGNIPDMAAIKEIANKHGIFIIEDAAEAMGSSYKGRKAGSLGNIGVFSFHGSKTMTTGEGGMLVTNSEDIYIKCLFFRDHGRSPGEKMFWNDEVAYKYKMSSMQAALGLAQLERIDELVERKRKIFNWYEQGLKDISGLKLNYEAADVINSYWMVTIVWDSLYTLTKEEMIEQLKRYNIDARPFFYPLSMMPAYKDLYLNKHYERRNNISYLISPYAVNLPCGMNMTEELVAKVCGVVRQVLLR